MSLSCCMRLARSKASLAAATSASVRCRSARAAATPASDWRWIAS